jgi:hypothetical protein
MLKDNVPVNAPLDFIKAQKLMEVEKLSKAMTEILALVAERDTRDRKAAIQKHNDKTHVRSPNFFVAEHRKRGTSKSQVKWKSPRLIVSVESDYVIVVENLLTKELKAAHATQLRFYQDKELNVIADLAQADERNDPELCVARFSRWIGQLETLLRYCCGCSGDGGEVHGVSRRHRHGAQDEISLRVLMGKLHALLRMSTLCRYHIQKVFL